MSAAIRDSLKSAGTPPPPCSPSGSLTWLGTPWRPCAAESSNSGAGQVMVTRTIVASADAVDGGIRFVDRGPASLKGFDQAVDVIEAVAGEAPHPPPAAVVPEGD